MASKILLAIALSLLVHVSVARQGQTKLSQAQQCWIERITASEPSRTIESEGGTHEFWDENEDQFQCAGVAAMRITIRPNALSVPTYLPAPQLIYIEKGRGILGITRPGCAETYSSEEESISRRRRGEEEEEGERSSEEYHQKIHRIRKGDIIVIPAGAAHWAYNDEDDKEIIAISIIDLNNQANQLDLNIRPFQIGGGQPREGQQSEKMQNMLRAFDAELLSEAYNVPTEIIRKIQQNDNRGGIVIAQQGMETIISAEEEEERQGQRNGAEETICAKQIKTNIRSRRYSDIFSRNAGRINLANRHNLPILTQVDMSAERGNLYPNALHTPHWTMAGHRIIYVIRGDARVQIIQENGDTILDEEVREGTMFVIPQFFPTVIKAGDRGFEWVAIKTSSKAKKVPIAGYTSVIRALPLEVITNSYQCSPSEAQNLKQNSGRHTLLLPPSDISY